MTDRPPPPAARLRHLLSLREMPAATLHALLDRAQALAEAPAAALRQRLAGQALCTLFFEPSTRTRSSFLLAAQRLGMDTLNLDLAHSSLGKGESETDTVRTLEAMGVRAFVVRHAQDGAVARLAAALGPDTAVINAGDGRSDHPTQGLLDLLTLRQAKGADFARLKVLIVGDVRHSRVARSDIHGLQALGCADIRVCGPAALLPAPEELPGCRFESDFDAALDGVDAIVALRLQRERMVQGLAPPAEAYFRDFGLSTARLARAAPGAVLLHPGPVNRGIELSDELADGPRSLILRQVANGVPVRMAVLEALLA